MTDYAELVTVKEELRRVRARLNEARYVARLLYRNGNFSQIIVDITRKRWPWIVTIPKNRKKDPFSISE